jgi:5-methylcytosine-specific restriction protein A
MPQKIPDSISRDDILTAISHLRGGGGHAFGDSTGYDVLFEGHRFPPKAVVGIAASQVLGHPLGPYDFKGGLQSKCFRVLLKNGFTIVTKGDTLPFPEEIPSKGGYVEGAVQEILVNKYERDPKARAKCISIHGLSCHVCEFNFSLAFGAVGEGFIHVHHLVPISDIGQTYTVDPAKDLVPVCPNCHAMLHKRMPPFSIDELRRLLKT